VHEHLRRFPSSFNSIVAKELFTTTATLEPDVKQLVYITDTGSKRNAFMVKCQTERPDSGFVKMQFVNCMPNTEDVAVSFIITANGRDTLVAHNLKFKEAADFKTIPLYTTPSFRMAVSDSLWIGKSVVDPNRDSVYAPPASVVGQTYSFAGIANRKVYTVTGRGFYKATNTVTIPKVSLVIVQ
jgi:hypothetical protein